MGKIRDERCGTPVFEALEPRLLLDAAIIDVSSDLDGFRFVAGQGVPSLWNTYEAEVAGSPTRVEFELGGRMVADAIASDGWSAEFDVSASSASSELRVRVYEGTVERDSLVYPVDVIDVPGWMLEPNVAFSVTADANTGYGFDVYVKDVDYGFSTPSDWAWTPPHFSDPLVDLANLRTGLDAGWAIHLQSTPGGGVYAYDLGYKLHAEVLGEEIWSHTLETGASGDFSLGSAEGTYSISFAPSFADDLTLSAVVGVASLDLNLCKAIPLAKGSIPLLGIPGILDLEFDLTMGVTVDLDADATIRLDGERMAVSSALFHPSITVDIAASGGAELLFGLLASAGVNINGTLHQDFQAAYDGSAWSYSAPGDLNIDGSLWWKALAGVREGGTDLFHWDVPDWDFIDETGSPSDQRETGDLPYEPAEPEIQQGISEDEGTPTPVEPDLDVNVVGDHPSGVSRYGYLLDRWKAPGGVGDWYMEEYVFTEEPDIPFETLREGHYRLRVFVEDAYGGSGTSAPRYFVVTHGPREGSDLAIAATYWRDGALSDGDGIPEAGEEAELDLLLTNTSDETVRNVTAWLRTSLGNIEITDAKVLYDALSPGDDSSGGNDYDMFLNFASTLDDVPLSLHLEYMKGDFEYFQDIPLSGVEFHVDGERFQEFEVTGYTVNDDPAYSPRNNGDGILQSGEEARIIPSLKNVGNVAADHVEVAVLPVYRPVEVDSATLVYGSIAPGQTSTPPDDFFRVEAGIDARFAGVVRLDVEVIWGTGESSVYLPNAIQLSVEQASLLEVRPGVSDFGIVDPGQDPSVTFTIHNNGSAPMEVTELRLSDTDVHVAPQGQMSPDGSFVVPAGGKIDVLVTLETGGIPNGTSVVRTIEVIAPEARITKPGEYDVHTMRGLVSSEWRVATIPTLSPPHNPDIAGSWVVWRESPDGNDDIFAFDLVAGARHRLTTDTDDQRKPKVSGDLVVWEDWRNWDGAGNADYHAGDIFGYDLVLGQEFVVSASPGQIERLIGVDGNRIAFIRGYEVLRGGANQEMAAACNLVVMEYLGNGQVVERFSTGWTPRSGTQARPSATANGDLGHGLLVFERKEWQWSTGAGGQWTGRPGPVEVLDLAADPSSPQLAFEATSEKSHYAAWAANQFLYVRDDAERDEQIYVWPGNQITPSNGDRRAYRLMAGDDGLFVYDKKGSNTVFYWDYSDGREYLLTTTVTTPMDGRMDGHGAAWLGADEQSVPGLYYTFLQQPDLAIFDGGVAFSDDLPSEGALVDATVCVTNITDFPYAGSISIALFDGDPGNGGQPLPDEAGNPYVLTTDATLPGDSSVDIELGGVRVPENAGDDDFEEHSIHARLCLVDSQDIHDNNVSASDLTVARREETSPTAELLWPRGRVDIDALNAAGHIDVVFRDSGGSGLSRPSIQDVSAEFELDGSAAAGVLVGGTPIDCLGGDEFSVAYRYGFSGAFVPGTVTIVFVGGSYEDEAGNPGQETVLGFDIFQPAQVVGRHVFYNNSFFDGDDPLANAADDGAIDPSKQALLPGETGTFDSYTSYTSGINGIMVDIASLSGTPTAGDFAFRMGDGNDLDAWVGAPAPVEIAVRSGEGVEGADRITLVWADNNRDEFVDPNEAVGNQWLEVTVLSDAHGGHLGLAEDDVFYFGNLVGDCVDPDSYAGVDDLDVQGMADAWGIAGVTTDEDIDHDGNVTIWDITSAPDFWGSHIKLLFRPNDAPFLTFFPATLPEHSPNGTVVGTADGHDADPGQSLTYEIIDGDPQGVFRIDPSTGEVTVANSELLDFETTPEHRFDLRVRVMDNGPPPLSDADPVMTVELTNVPEVQGRHVFYNNSHFDGSDPAANAGDDDAVALDKEALLPGTAASSANYTSYSRGINGLMIDVDGLLETLTDADFGIRVNEASDPDTWSVGPAPAVTARPGDGVGDSDRVTLIWADGAIANRWIEVTVFANANTGLAADDVFYFGNSVGDCDGDGEVGGSDYGTFAGQFGLRGGIGTLAADLNGDGRVDLTDLAAMRDARGNSVLAPTIPAAPAAPPAAGGEAGLDVIAVPAAATLVNPGTVSDQPCSAKQLAAQDESPVIPSTALRASSDQLTATDRQ